MRTQPFFVIQLLLLTAIAHAAQDNTADPLLSLIDTEVHRSLCENFDFESTGHPFATFKARYVFGNNNPSDVIGTTKKIDGVPILYFEDLVERKKPVKILDGPLLIPMKFNMSPTEFIPNFRALKNSLLDDPTIDDMAQVWSGIYKAALDLTEATDFVFECIEKHPNNSALVKELSAFLTPFISILITYPQILKNLFVLDERMELYKD